MIELPDDRDVALVSVDDLTTYLRARGWRASPGLSERVRVWQVPPDHAGSRSLDVDELILPVSTGWLDHNRRLAEAIGTLSLIEHRPATTIIREVLTSESDVIRLKRPDVTPEGSIPLSDGVTLIDQAVDMMTAAACSAVVPRRVVPSRRPLSAMEYLRRVRLGQTEKSSYVITIISPLQRLAAEEPTLFEKTEDSFSRRVTKTLSSGLSALVHATESVRRDGDYRVFEDVVGSGVSANLCEAVAHLVRADERESAVSIQVDWALARPYPDAPSPVAFEPDAEPYLQEAAKRFRAAEPLEGTFLTGVVVRLQRGRDQLEGRITVSCVLDGILRQLIVPLGLADYQNAVDAHRDRRGVAFRADVRRVGRQYIATNIREFRVL